MNKSLASQNVPHNSTVIVKFLETEKTGWKVSSVPLISLLDAAADVNIWNEPEDSSTIILDTDRNVRAATLNKLIALVSSEVTSG